MKNSDEDDFMSNIFIRPTKNRKQRVILNLKRLNNCVEYHHFKMETLKAAISLIYLRIVTWRQLIYRMRIILVKSMLMTGNFFLNWQKKYQYTCLAMGLASAPRIFTKLMKPALLTFRKQEFSNIAYIDDITFKCL